MSEHDDAARETDRCSIAKHRALKAIMRARGAGFAPTAALVSYDDVAGTELAFRPTEVDGVRVDSSRLVPPGKVFVDVV